MVRGYSRMEGKLKMRQLKTALTVALIIVTGVAGSLSFTIFTGAAKAHAATATEPAEPPNPVRDLIESYNVDRGNLSRTYSDPLSPVRRTRFKQFFEQWRASLTKIDFASLNEDG